MATHKEYGLNGVNSVVELGKGGANVKNSSGVVEARNNADDAYAVVRAASPVAANDVVTKAYLEAYGSPVVYGNIYDVGAGVGGSTQFTGAGQEGLLAICNDTGLTGFTKNYLYRLDTWDTDVDNSTWTEIVPTEGMTFAMTDASSGGDETYEADHVYIWDTDGTPSWQDIGPAASQTYYVKAVSGNALETDGDGSHTLDASAPSIPAAARITDWQVDVIAAFLGSGTPTMSLDSVNGSVGDIAATTEIDLENTGLYTGKCYIEATASDGIEYTLTNMALAGQTGDAEITVSYSVE